MTGAGPLNKRIIISFNWCLLLSVFVDCHEEPLSLRLSVFDKLDDDVEGTVIHYQGENGFFKFFDPVFVLKFVEVRVNSSLELFLLLSDLALYLRSSHETTCYFFLNYRYLSSLI